MLEVHQRAFEYLQIDWACSAQNPALLPKLKQTRKTVEEQAKELDDQKLAFRRKYF